MRYRNVCCLPLRVLFALVGSLFVSIGSAAISLEDDFERDETVRSISVTVVTGEHGETVDESIALDLGLGFPLWLAPLGQDPDQPTPFGGLPDQSDPGRTQPAGQTRTYHFHASAVGSGDSLSSLPALLNDVRVSDIARIGVCGTGASDWCLNQIEIRINDKPFYSADELDVHIQNEQALAQLRLHELQEEIAPMIEEAESLQELVRSGLATEDEEQRLRDIDELIVPQQQEQNRIERQLAGSYPWFVARDFHSPWRNGHNVDSMSVTLVTGSHTGADTRNFVYYQTGGRKYLLSSPRNPLQAHHGPQVFSIDLIGGPATAGDLRGHSIGMLAHGERQGDVPDRAHVQRLLVEVDGRIVFDSEENELDRLSLEATRLIPPAHFNEVGEVVANTPIARETFVWKAGQGFGLDLVNGGAEALPDPGEESWPQPEPGLPYDPTAAAEALPPGFSESIEPFPGEVYEEPDWAMSEEEWASESWEDDPWAGDPWAGDPWSGPEGGGSAPGDWGWEPPASWLDVLAGLLLDRLGFDLSVLIESVEEAVAEPIGEPVQIQNVAFEFPTFTAPEWRVGWGVSGDEASVDHYLVEMMVLRPHDPEGNLVVVGETTIPAGEHVAVFPVDADTVRAEIESDPFSVYLLPRVTPVLIEDLLAGPGQFGFALSLGEAEDTLQMLDDFYQFALPGMLLNFGPLLERQPVLSDTRAVWTGPSVATQLGFVFASSPNIQHLVLRPEPTDLSVAYRFDEDLTDAASRQVVCHLGFLGDLTDVPNTADIRIEARLDSTVSDRFETVTEMLTVNSGTWEDPQPMPLVALTLPAVVDPATSLAEPARLSVRVSVDGGIADMTRPPVVVGLRSFPTF